MGIVSLNFPLHPQQREAGMLDELASVDSNFPTWVLPQTLDLVVGVRQRGKDFIAI